MPENLNWTISGNFFVSVLGNFAASQAGISTLHKIQSSFKLTFQQLTLQNANKCYTGPTCIWGLPITQAIHPQSRGKRKNKVTCFSCRGGGHFIWDCSAAPVKNGTTIICPFNKTFTYLYKVLMRVSLGKWVKVQNWCGKSTCSGNFQQGLLQSRHGAESFLETAQPILTQSRGLLGICAVQLMTTALWAEMGGWRDNSPAGPDCVLQYELCWGPTEPLNC